MTSTCCSWHSKSISVSQVHKSIILNFDSVTPRESSEPETANSKPQVHEIKTACFFPQLPAVKARIPKALVAKPQWTPIVQIKIASKSLTGYMAGLPVHHSWQAFQSPAPWARCKTCHGIVSSTSLGKVTSGNLESAIPQLTWHSWSWNEHFKIPFRTLTLVKEQMPVGDSQAHHKWKRNLNFLRKAPDESTNHMCGSLAYILGVTTQYKPSICAMQCQKFSWHAQPFQSFSL